MHDQDHDANPEVRLAERLDAAERRCAQRGERLTPLRRRVLEIVHESRRAMGAYEILETLSQERGRVAPPTVYRALDFLSGQGLIHRVHSRNAFVGCCGADMQHMAELLICRRCGATDEVANEPLGDEIRAHAGSLGFRADAIVLEVQGVCAACTSRP
jgi:Fur family transcriptional regulator, zinc uptake regulator